MFLVRQPCEGAPRADTGRVGIAVPELEPLSDLDFGKRIAVVELLAVSAAEIVLTHLII
jgi:hypothetical protein